MQYHKFPENRGPCPARNYGAGLSKNEWLLFLDDDGLAADGMLDAYAKSSEKIRVSMPSEEKSSPKMTTSIITCKKPL